jgi:hypothetical protein
MYVGAHHPQVDHRIGIIEVFGHRYLLQQQCPTEGFESLDDLVSEFVYRIRHTSIL